MTAPSTEDESLFNISEDLIPSNIIRQSNTASLSFSDLLSPPLRLQTNEAECGGQLWPAGMVLAEYLLRNKMDDMRGKTILELGTGSGLVGYGLHMMYLPQESIQLIVRYRSLALALAVQHSLSTTTEIHLTDGLPALIPLLHHNIALNFPHTTPNLKVFPTLLDWAQSLPDTIPKHPDVLLAADCAYLQASFPPLLKTIQELTGEETVLWFCYKKRRRADGGMVRILSKVFSVVEVKGGKWEKEGVYLYEVKRRREKRANR